MIRQTNKQTDNSDYNFINIDIEIWRKLLTYISGNIDSTKNADHILEMSGLGELCGYFSIILNVKVGWRQKW